MQNNKNNTTLINYILLTNPASKSYRPAKNYSANPEPKKTTTQTGPTAAQTTTVIVQFEPPSSPESRPPTNQQGPKST